MKKLTSLAIAMIILAATLSACGSTAVKEIVVESIPAKEEPKIDQPKTEEQTKSNEAAKNETNEPSKPAVEEPKEQPKNEPESKLKKIDWFSTITSASQNGNAFNLEWVDEGGNPKKLTDLGGKVYLIDVWAQWCSPCRASTPTLVELHNKYSQLGLVVIGINIDDQSNIMQAMQFAGDEGIINRYPVLYDNQGGMISGVFVQQGIPNFTLLDKNGKLITTHTGGLVKGYEGFDEFERLITENLK